MNGNGRGDNMDSQQIKFIKELSKNNFSSTCEAEIDGIRYVVKCISVSDQIPADVEKIKLNLDAQIKFSETLASEYQKGIALFSNSCKYDKKLCYFRLFIDGMSLAEKIKENKFLGVDEASQIILKIARLLACAHQRGIIHGDLKPENIIISADNSISIIDWETMKLNREAQNLYANGRTLKPEELVGTPHYMAPEQCAGETCEQSDVYALGMIYYKMLTGETPFDDLEILKIYEAKHYDIDDIVFHDKKINADIAQIITSALKVDRNGRTRSVDQLVQELENFLNISSSIREVPVTESAVGEVIIDSSPGVEEHKLVLIGHPGAGKTVLAAGLYSMNNEKFSVEGTNSETIKFMNEVKTILQRGEWPEPTAKSGVKKLDFSVFYNNHKHCISFDEYAGENVLSANYFKEFFTPCPAGAIILLNPSFIVAVDDLTQNKQISSLKNCISYLSGLENPPPIAFVITAADRLETDLKDRAAEFEKYKQEIKNSLSAHKMDFKIFDVSVTGKIDNNPGNLKAALNPENVQKPFLWILSRINQGKTLSVFKKFTRWCVTALVLLALAAAGRWGYEWYIHNDLSNRFNQFKAVHSEAVTADKLNDYIKDLSELRGEWCLKHHINVEKNTGSQTGECNSECIKWTQRCHFPDRREAWANTIREIEEEIDRVNLRRLEKLYEDLKPGKDAFPDNCKYLEQDLNEWAPLSELKLKEQFQEGIFSKIQAEKERHQFLVAEKKLKDIVKKKAAEYPSDLAQEVNKLPKKEQTKLGSAEWKSFSDRINKYRLEALQSVERVNIDNIKNLLTGVIENEKCKIFPVEIDSKKGALPTESNLDKADKQRLDDEVTALYNQARRCVALRIANGVKAILSSVAAAPEKGFPADYEQEYRNWCDSKKFMNYSPESKQEAEKIENEIISLKRTAHKTVFDYSCQTQQHGIESFNGSAADFADLIRKFNQFFESNVHDVQEEHFNAQKQTCFTALETRLEKYIQDWCSNFDKKQMNEKSELIPDTADIINVLLPLIPENTRNKLQTQLNGSLEGTKNKWTEERREVINDFIQENKDKNAFDSLNGIKTLVVKNEESENPFLQRAEKFVLNKIQNEVCSFRDKVYIRNFSEKDFIYIKRLAESANGNTIKKFCPILKNALICAWLNKYYEWKNANTDLEVTIGYPSIFPSYRGGEAYFQSLYWHIYRRAGEKDREVFYNYGSRGYENTFKIDQWSGFKPTGKDSWPSKNPTAHIGTKFKFHAAVWNTDGFFSRNYPITDIDYEFYPGVDDVNGQILRRGNHRRKPGDVTVSLYITVTGVPLKRWLNSNPVPEAR